MKSIEVGSKAPNFTLKDNKEQDITLSDYRGKKVNLPSDFSLLERLQKNTEFLMKSMEYHKVEVL